MASLNITRNMVYWRGNGPAGIAMVIRQRKAPIRMVSEVGNGMAGIVLTKRIIPVSMKTVNVLAITVNGIQKVKK